VDNEMNYVLMNVIIDDCKSDIGFGRVR